LPLETTVGLRAGRALSADLHLLRARTPRWIEKGLDRVEAGCRAPRGRGRNYLTARRRERGADSPLVPITKEATR
jgi:hypothetical protein